jgi:hypothetical protein
MAQRKFIPNQVFIGLPWKNVRKRYETLLDRLQKSSPLSFVIVGRSEDQDAEDLLEVIKGKLESSSYAIFDATRGNANVSLEYGYAEAKNIPRALYVSAHKAAGKTGESAIISDLAGKKRNHYTTEKGLLALLRTFSKNHAYTKRFERALQVQSRGFRKGEKKSMRSLSLKILHLLDGQSDIRREDMVQTLRADGLGYGDFEIEDTIKRLRRSNLIYVEPGRYSSVSIA